jgi:hypothetical protein
VCGYAGPGVRVSEDGYAGVRRRAELRDKQKKRQKKKKALVRLSFVGERSLVPNRTQGCFMRAVPLSGTVNCNR